MYIIFVSFYVDDIHLCNMLYKNFQSLIKILYINIIN